MDKLRREVNFLDLTIKINDLNQIETRTYQKPMNLYLYIPQASAHPKAVYRGMVKGEVRRCKLQCSRREDYLEMVRLLYVRSRARGWSAQLLKEWILSAANDLELNRSKKTKEDVDRRQRLFIHMRYHPKGISRQHIRAAFDRTCNNFEGTEVDLEQVTVAFSQPTNLKEELTSAKFHPATFD